MTVALRIDTIVVREPAFKMLITEDARAIKKTILKNEFVVLVVCVLLLFFFFIAELLNKGKEKL